MINVVSRSRFRVIVQGAGAKLTFVTRYPKNRQNAPISHITIIHVQPRAQGGDIRQPRSSKSLKPTPHEPVAHLSNQLTTAAQLYKSSNDIGSLLIEIQNSIRYYTARLKQDAGVILATAPRYHSTSKCPAFQILGC